MTPDRPIPHFTPAVLTEREESVTDLPGSTRGPSPAPQDGAQPSESLRQSARQAEGGLEPRPGPNPPGHPIPAAVPLSASDESGAAPEAKRGADWRKAVKDAQSKQAAEGRRRRGKYTPRHVKAAQRGAAGPGMLRRLPPSEPGA